MNSVFVSFPFDRRFEKVFETIRAAATQRKLNSIRVDQTSSIAEPLANIVHHKIRESRLVIADITGNNPNVLNEVGLAQAFGKPLVLITQDQHVQAPFNIRHLRILRYDTTDLSGFQRIIEQAVIEATSPSETLRAMLVPSTLGQPTRQSWFVIAASPLSYRRARGRHGGYKTLRRTSSDYVGVRGILQSFGLLFGFEVLPDNLDPEDCDDCVLLEPMNLYCIASPKANRWTRILLAEYAKRWVPNIEFRADPASRDLRNVYVSIFADGQLVCPPGWEINSTSDRYARDFGIIVRGPNPYHTEHMIAIVAGRSSLGTEAACTAFTDPAAIEIIRQRLVSLHIDFENHQQPFWALVSMQALDTNKHEAVRETLRIHGVAEFVRKQGGRLD